MESGFMDRNTSPAPAPGPASGSSGGIVQGLRRLVHDLQTLSNPEIGGLSRIFCGRTRLISCSNGEASYCGQPLVSLAAEPFEQTALLLLLQTQPSEELFADWTALIRDAGVLEESPGDLFSHLPAGLRPLELFPLCLQLLSLFNAESPEQTEDAGRALVWRLMGRLPLLFNAALHSSGTSTVCGAAEISEAESGLTWAGRLLMRLRGTADIPSPAEEAAMNTLLVCTCLTEMRPACFVARVAASTRCGLTAALQSAATLFAAQLQNDPYEWTARLLQGFSSSREVDAWLNRRERPGMPFGFASTVADNRARILASAAETLLGCPDRIRVAAVAARFEKRLITENLAPTLDWSAIRLMVLLNLPADRQSLVIGMARLIGWAAHAIEQQKSGVSLLPGLRYGDAADESESV
jgi:citrate synthase